MKTEKRILLGLLPMALAFPLLAPGEYLVHLGVVILFYVMLALSLNLIVGYVGEFSLGHTAFLGIGAYTAAILATKAGFPIWAAVACATAIAGLAGLLIGGITLRLQGPFFVIVTLSFAEVLRLVADNWISVTNGPMGISGIPTLPSWTEPGSPAGRVQSYYVALGLVCLMVYLSWRFVASATGRAAMTVRENRYVAQSVGIRPIRYAMIAIVLGAMFCGAAGGFYAHYISFVGPEMFRFSFMVSMIIMVLLGGKGTLVGPIAGALIVTLLEEYLREAKELRLTLFGAIVMLVVLFLPQGLFGFLARLDRKTRES